MYPGTLAMLSGRTLRFFGTIVLVSTLLLMSGGCSIRKMATSMISDVLSGDGGTVFSGDDDPQLIKDALPFALKLYESLLEKNPNHVGLLLATGKAYTLYAYAFVHFPSDTLSEELSNEQSLMRKRARKLYLRGRDYVLRGLEVRHPGISRKIREKNIDSALALTNTADTALLYWAGMAWMGAITTSGFDLGMMMSMPRAVGLMRRTHTLNEAFGNGATHEFFLSYYANLPPSMGGSEEKAREHFTRSIELSKGSKPGPYVSLASSVCVKKQDQEEFTRLLNTALSINPDDHPRDRLSIMLAQNKARWMLENAGRFFLDSEPEEP